MAIRAVLFDVDGTLVQSNGGHAASWSAAASKYGFARPARFFEPLIGMGGDRILPLIDQRLNEEQDPGRAIAAARGRIFEERYLPLLKPTSGAKALVEQVRGSGLQCVVASSAKDEELEALLAVADVSELFDARTTSDDAERSKPAADIIEKALRKAGISANEAVLVGDTPYDVKSASKAGVIVIALRCGGWNDSGLEGAAEIYDDPADLLRHYEVSTLRHRAN